ncbi:MAG TPA: phosphatase PAP2 family protein [Thermoanaerobaculia bacterium]
MRRLLLLLVALLACSCTYVRQAGRDVVAVAHGPRVRSAVVATAATGAALLVDDEVARIARRNDSSSLNRIADAVEPLGGGMSDKVIAGYLLYGVVAKQEKARNIAFDAFVASTIASRGITPMVKLLTNRTRPNGGHDSFPSNHATQAFAVAAVIAAHDERPWVKRLAYGLATGVAFARVYHDAHWASDVVAGAAIGTFTGHTVAVTNRKWRVTPLIREGAIGVMISR